MFSQLGPLFKTTFRQAESNDTRQYIPHEERQRRRKKIEEENRKEKKSDLWDDDTSVSVEALRTFLIDFLKTMPEAQSNKTTTTQSQDINQSKPTTTQNPQSAKAIAAYQAIAQTSPPVINKEEKDQTKKMEPTADQLQSKEVRDIHKLISDLEILAREGIKTLHILKADSFIQSLQNAVLLVKSKI